MNFVCFVVLHFRAGYVYVYSVDFDEKPPKLKSFFRAYLATNSVGLVIKGIFLGRKINSFFFHQPKNVNKNTSLEIANATNT